MWAVPCPVPRAPLECASPSSPPSFKNNVISFNLLSPARCAPVSPGPCVRCRLAGGASSGWRTKGSCKGYRCHQTGTLFLSSQASCIQLILIVRARPLVSTATCNAANTEHTRSVVGVPGPCSALLAVFVLAIYRTSLPTFVPFLCTVSTRCKCTHSGSSQRYGCGKFPKSLRLRNHV